jgi:hypothetical protein
MEVREEESVRSLDDVGNAGGVEVHAKHLRALLVPGPRPHRRAGGLACQIVAQHGDGPGRQRLLDVAARLVLARGQYDAGQVVIEQEPLGAQDADLAGTETGRHRHTFPIDR